MTRTTVSLDEETLRELRKIAAERGISIAALVREGIEQAVSNHRPRPRSLGVGASGHTDTARLSGDQRPEPRQWR
jgi:predicted DNA-binding ribbon-helix-helix protein